MGWQLEDGPLQGGRWVRSALRGSSASAGARQQLVLAKDSTLKSMEGSGLVVGANLGYGSAFLQRCTVSDNEEKGIRVGKRGRVHAENCQVDRNEEFNVSVVGGGTASLEFDQQQQQDGGLAHNGPGQQHDGHAL